MEELDTHTTFGHHLIVDVVRKSAAVEKLGEHCQNKILIEL